mmetsp:Transcript_36314/g.40532  ORF Transcript_36314/g.40532 Transcript_36314/m.40532 type:complete len:372 (-) Transcript_36314:762-1877(-)
MFEWHFTIRGAEETDFEGGLYHGRILLPAEYPYKPPHIIFLTKSGRFEINTKVCLSFSAYHPELWQPAWGIRLILEALISFLPTKGDGAIGSLDWSPHERRRLATESHKYSCPQCGPIVKLLPLFTPEEKKKKKTQLMDSNSNKKKTGGTFAKEIAELQRLQQMTEQGRTNNNHKSKEKKKKEDKENTPMITPTPTTSSSSSSNTATAMKKNEEEQNKEKDVVVSEETKKKELSSSLSSSSSSLSNTNLIGRTVSPGSLGVWCDDPDLKKHAEGGGMSLRHYDPVYVIYDSHEGASWNYGCKGWAWYANNSDIDVCGSRGYGSGPCLPQNGNLCCDPSKVGIDCAKIDYGTKDEYRDYNKPTKHWYCSEYN